MRNITIALLASFGATSAAQAQFVPNTTFFEGVVGEFYEEGVGAPVVTWHNRAGHFVMLFETQTAIGDATCPDGYWSIGAAWSDDGLNWEVGAYPVIEPTAGTYAGCGVRQPTMLRKDDNYMVWFTTFQEADACANGTPSWGCTRDTGIGYTFLRGSWATNGVDFRLSFSLPIQLLTPVIEGPGYDEPTVLAVQGEPNMYVAQYGEILHAVGSDPTQWTFDAAPAVVPGFDTWSQDQLYSPSVICADNAGGGTGINVHPPRFDLYFGGRTWDFLGGIAEAGWSNGDSVGGSQFMMNPLGAAATWANFDEYISFDAMNAGGTTLMWFEETAVDGKPHIGFTDDGAWTSSDISGRICQ